MLGYQIVECEGYEADDILGTLARVCTEEGHECVLATGDRDSLQLVGPAVTVRLAATKFGQPVVTVYDETKVKEDYGVTPHQLIDIKALQGDSSSLARKTRRRSKSRLLGELGNLNRLGERAR